MDLSTEFDTDPVIAAVRAGLMLAARTLPPGVVTAGLLGADRVAEAYLRLLPELDPSPVQLAFFLVEDGYELWDRHAEALRAQAIELTLALSAREAALGADLVALATPGALRSLRRDWLLPDVTVVTHCPIPQGWELLRGVHRRLRPGGDTQSVGRTPGLTVIEAPIGADEPSIPES